MHTNKKSNTNNGFSTRVTYFFYILLQKVLKRFFVYFQRNSDQILIAVYLRIFAPEFVLAFGSVNCRVLVCLLSYGLLRLGKPESQVRRVSHCGSKQHERSHAVLTVLLLVRAHCICVLFFAHIPFVVNRTFSNRITG